MTVCERRCRSKAKMTNPSRVVQKQELGEKKGKVEEHRSVQYFIFQF